MSASLELAGAGVDKEAILKALNLNPRDPKTQALLLVCERYQLDPLLKHMVLISGNPYITRDGYLAIAHRTGKFDGLEVLEEGADQTHWWAKVAVWRKDMSHPFTYVGRYPKSGHQKNYGPEMAIKCAEVMGLRRAFNVTGVGAADERWDDDGQETTDRAPAERAALPPADVNPATGEIVDTTSQPDAQQSVLQAGLRATEQRRSVPAPTRRADTTEYVADEKVADLRDRIGKLDGFVLDEIRDEWKSLVLPNITRPDAKLTPDQLAKATELVEKAEKKAEAA